MSIWKNYGKCEKNIEILNLPQQKEEEIIKYYNQITKLYTYYKVQSVIVYIKISDIYKDIVEHFETRFDASNYDLDRPLPKRKNEKVIGLMKEELDEKIMTKFVTVT